MPLTISGKHMDVGDALRQRIDDRLSESVAKYFDGKYTGQVTLKKSAAGFDADCMVHLDTGIILRASGNAGDATHAFEGAAEKIDKRLRRYKRRLKAHHTGGPSAGEVAAAAMEFQIETPDDEDELEANYAPLVVAETPTKIKTMTVGMAVLELDLTETPALMFMNAANKTLNVVFRRADGNVGWIDPSMVSGTAAVQSPGTAG
ncbi:ribosome-associated translation inhibitor RaiA [Acuticoccus sp. MNP-M23]|uniref:ribosome hibernation-promoting factor, HPF/YfiA family n=1 Tax=Acuticoccus sp. MNP-M23 TaxID=3072793 RepID=UPI00281671C1|nr:ribosome-associated translation inhibitor RaiA [Acuticoccus sp. MNP-M23]WMS42900.1 ribosome-associated translation inhibitor RaiA [Acuticoccus sp. MNP-M23]